MATHSRNGCVLTRAFCEVGRGARISENTTYVRVGPVRTRSWEAKPWVNITTPASCNMKVYTSKFIEEVQWLIDTTPSTTYGPSYDKNEHGNASKTLCTLPLLLTTVGAGPGMSPDGKAPSTRRKKGSKSNPEDSTPRMEDFAPWGAP